MSLREKIAEGMLHAELQREGAEVFSIAEAGEHTRHRFLRAADDVIASLPGCIKPLEWEEQTPGCWFAKCPLGDRLDFYRVHAHRDGDGYVAYFREFSTGKIPSAEGGFRASEARHRDRVMSAFGL